MRCSKDENGNIQKLGGEGWEHDRETVIKNICEGRAEYFVEYDVVKPYAGRVSALQVQLTTFDSVADNALDKLPKC